MGGAYSTHGRDEGSIKGGKFLDQLNERLLATQEGLCSMELVT
jgi:hypothetical protein